MFWRCLGAWLQAPESYLGILNAHLGPQETFLLGLRLLLFLGFEKVDIVLTNYNQQRVDLYRENIHKKKTTTTTETMPLYFPLPCDDRRLRLCNQFESCGSSMLFIGTLLVDGYMCLNSKLSFPLFFLSVFFWGGGGFLFKKEINAKFF